MSHKARVDNIEYVELLLEAVLERYGSIKVFEFIQLVKKKCQCTETTARDYVMSVINLPQFEDNKFDIWLRNKKPKVLQG